MAILVCVREWGKVRQNLPEEIYRVTHITTSTRSTKADSRLLLETLAEFRYELRQFLHFSERAAVEVGLQPQQHQLLLQVAGTPEGKTVTIVYAAERLSLRHNSVVELVNRSEREGLLVRTEDTVDRRQFCKRRERASGFWRSWQAIMRERSMSWPRD